MLLRQVNKKREFVTLSARAIGIEIVWSGEERKGEVSAEMSASKLVKLSSRTVTRPTEVETLLGDPSLAKSQLGWAPECSIHEVAKEMMAHDMSIARSAVILRNATSE